MSSLRVLALLVAAVGVLAACGDRDGYGDDFAIVVQNALVPPLAVTPQVYLSGLRALPTQGPVRPGDSVRWVVGLPPAYVSVVCFVPGYPSPLGTGIWSTTVVAGRDYVPSKHGRVLIYVR